MTPTGAVPRSVLWIAFAAALAGCETESVRIIGHCEPASDVTRVVPVAEPPFGTMAPALGMVGGDTLVSWSEVDLSSAAPLHDTYSYSRWLDDLLRPTGTLISHGRSRMLIYRPRWVALDGALWAQLWSDPDDTVDSPKPPDLRPRDDQTVALWSLTPGSDSPRRRRVGVMTRWGCSGCVSVGLGTQVNPGFRGLLPVAAVGTSVWGAFTAAAADGICLPERAAPLARLQVIESTGSTARPVLWNEPCSDASDPHVSNPWLFALGDDTLAVLMRLDFRDVYFLPLRTDGSPIGEPRRVGASRRFPVDDGYQPRAVAVGGGRVLFTEVRSGGYNDCHAIRVMNDDGTDATDAPWQLPCASGAHPVIGSVELLALPGGAAVLVWNERTRLGGPYVTSDAQYEESVRAVVLTPEGQRGSEIVTVTDPEATALQDVPRTETRGPVPADFLPGVANDGESIVVGWLDKRVSSPGIYARTLRCTLDP